MSAIEIFIRFDWISAGAVLQDESGRLVFPCGTPETPGLYMFRFVRDDASFAYIGESDRLRRRLKHYRTPGPTQHTNIRISALLREIITSGAAVSLCVVTGGAWVEFDGRLRIIDLNRKSERVLLEHAAIYSAVMTDISVLNLSVPAIQEAK